MERRGSLYQNTVQQGVMPHPSPFLPLHLLLVFSIGRTQLEARGQGSLVGMVCSAEPPGAQSKQSGREWRGSLGGKWRLPHMETPVYHRQNRVGWWRPCKSSIAGQCWGS